MPEQPYALFERVLVYVNWDDESGHHVHWGEGTVTGILYQSDMVMDSDWAYQITFDEPNGITSNCELPYTSLFSVYELNKLD